MNPARVFLVLSVFLLIPSAVRMEGGDPNDGEEALLCSVRGSHVTLTWKLSSNVLALGFIVRRGETVVATLDQDARTYSEEAPAGKQRYQVSTNNKLGGNGAPDFLIGSCEVVVEEGGSLPAPKDLQCAIAESFPVQVQLFWKNPVAYDSLVVTRDGVEIEVLGGDAVRFSETDPGPGEHTYGVSGTRDDEVSRETQCRVKLDGPPPPSNTLLLVPQIAGGGGGDPGEDPNKDPGDGDPNTDPNTDPDNPGVVASDTLWAVLRNSDPIQGWSFGVCSDPSVLEVVSATTEGTATEKLNDGEGPTFLAVNRLENGVAMAVVIDETDPDDVLPPGGNASLLVLRYGPGPKAERGEPYPVSFCGNLGDPAVAVVLVAGGFEVRPAVAGGTVLFAAQQFLRGDSNDDGKVNMSDGVFTLEWLFRGGDQPGCLEAADANGSREVNIADAVYTFQSLFTGGAPPPSPFPECGSARLFLGCDASVCEG